MGIKRYTADKDNTIANAFDALLNTRATGSNMGGSDIIEVFSIYGQRMLSASTTGIASTQELSRGLIQFPVTSITTDRSSGQLPASGSVSFYLRMFNAKHGNTTPREATYVVVPVSVPWQEGLGLDMDSYKDLSKNYFGSNWIQRSASTDWTTIGGDYLNQHAKTKTLSKGTEDLEVDITDIVEKWIHGASGGGYENYGLGVHLTSSQEAYFSSSTGNNIDQCIHNPSGSKRSYYTKKFFSRTTEFFLKKPVIEARWDSAIKDDRGKAFYSSSLLTSNDNLNTLYLYNYVNGQLKNIPNTNTLFVRLYSGSATEPTGSAFNLVTSTTYVNSHSPAVVTGGLVSTGIYSASFAMTAAATPVTTVYDVWHLNDAAGGKIGTQVRTGSFSPTVYSISSAATESSYVFNISNLRSSYLQNENARFKVFSRLKNWNPTIYTSANADPQNYIIEDIYYRLIKVIDGEEVISYGTGSATSPQASGAPDSFTRLSYDSDGSYFDLDMSLLEPGYMYRIELLYYNSNSYVKAANTFKFRVEEDLSG